MDDLQLQGTILKGYQLKEQVGRGGFGAVYRAKQIAVEREVAVKIILPKFANHADFIRRFEAEAYLIARLEHPHITPLHDFWRDPNGAYLVMRFLRGGSVQRALTNGSYELDATSSLLDQIASALDFAHRNGVIHRDIKPGNILLDEDGNAYLADFGIAKAMGTFKGDHTTADMIVGSPDYISPEQARSETVTPCTDIYSLGVTLYEMITGQHPFQHASTIEQLYKHINDPLPKIGNVPDKFADSLNDVLQQATAKDPHKRYPDVLALAGAFREAIGRGTTQPDASIVDQLTIREQEVLSLIVSGMSNTEIAAKLVVTMSTVKWHITQLYKKLGVRSRVQAIVRARELNLISPFDNDVSARGFSDMTHQSAAVSLPELENPYKGLHAFQVTDERDFFGRDDLTKRIIERMCDNDPYHRFLTIVGPSGSGKSSLVKAGLIPALWRGAIPGSEKWFVVDMIPGTHPLDKLETTLIRVATHQSDNLREQLQRNDRGLLRVADIILPDDDAELVIVVDQFEEVFTLVDDEAQRQQFLDLLRVAVSDVRSRIRVILTLRADYYDRPLHYPEFGELIRNRIETVLPLTAQGLERAIRGPAERVGVTFEQGLVEHIVSTMNYQAGALPLLQYALTELFDHRENRLLTHTAYQEIGEAVGALTHRADDIYRSLTDEGQHLARQMFLRLVTLGEGAEDTRRRVTQPDLLSLADDADLMEELIDQFASYRLLSLDHDPDTRLPTVEVAHEAILREWDRLRWWLNESRDDIRQERALTQAAEEWDVHNRERSYLLRGSRLEQAEKWQQSTRLIQTPLEQDFIQHSILQRKQEQESEEARKAHEAFLERRSRNVLRMLVMVFALAAAIAIGLSLVAVYSRNEAATERDNAQANFVRAERIRLAAQAQIALDKGEDVRIPALLALRSLELGYSAEADGALLTALSRDFARQTYVGHTGNGLYGVYFSPDGKHVLTTSEDATARLWDTFSGTEQTRFSGHQGLVTDALFTPAGDSILTSGVDGTVRQWDLTTGEEIRRVLDQEIPIWTIDLSPDGQMLITGDETGMVKLWELEQMALILEITGPGETVIDARFSPDGQSLVTGGRDKIVHLWDVKSGMEIERFEGHAARINVVGFSPDGREIFSSSDDATVRLWDVQTGEEIRKLVGSGWMRGAAISPDGRLIVAGSSDKVVRLWDTQTGEELRQFHGHTAGAGHTAFSPDGQYIISGSIDNVARLWEIESESEPRIYARPFSTVHAESVRLAVLSDQDHQIIAVSGSGIIQTWNVETGQSEREIIIDNGSFVLDAALSSQHNQMLVASQDGIVRSWDLEIGELVRQYEGHVGAVNGIAASRTSDFFVTGSDDGTAMLWTVESELPLQRFAGHTAPVNKVAISSDNRLVATASDDGTARLWDTETGAEIRQLSGHQNRVLDVAFSPDGRLLLTGGADHLAFLWDVASGEHIQTYVGHTLDVSVVAFSADGRSVITGSRDQTARIWDAATGKVIRQFVGHDNTLLTVSMSDDGELLVTGDIGRTYLWRTNLGEVIALACEKLPSDLTPEERTLYAIQDEKTVCP